MLELTVAVLASLFSVVNPLGAVPVFLALTPDQSPGERNKTSWHTSLYFVLISLSFFFAGSISLLISMYTEHEAWPSRFIIAGVVIIMGLLVYLILNSAPYLYRLLGVAGLRALTRIMGFIVMAIGVQYIISGVVRQVTNMV